MQILDKPVTKRLQKEIEENTRLKKISSRIHPKKKLLKQKFTLETLIDYKVTLNIQTYFAILDEIFFQEILKDK